MLNPNSLSHSPPVYPTSYITPSHCYRTDLLYQLPDIADHKPTQAFCFPTLTWIHFDPSN